jgi:hypothetical protein
VYFNRDFFKTRTSIHLSCHIGKRVGMMIKVFLQARILDAVNHLTSKFAIAIAIAIAIATAIDIV